jgi:glycosyltransferase involved in cell wall biosynthesis
MARHLFIHPNFPGQFLHVANHLVREGGHEVIGVGEYDNVRQQAQKVPSVKLLGYKMPRRASKETHHYLRGTEENALRAQAVLRLCSALKRQGFMPDVIAAHTGWGDTLFLREIFPHARMAGYFEYYYRSHGADIGFDPEFPMSLDNLLEVRMKNATALLAWEDCNVAWTPTAWQASLFPVDLRPRLQILHEGIDTSIAKPNPQATATLPNGLKLQAGDEILTLVNRNMEPYRGFHVFMRALPEIQRRRPNAITLITGTDSGPAYGNRNANGDSWKTILLREAGDNLDMSRIHFLGKLPFEMHLRVLQLSRAHVYLTYPYFVSWSMLEAMSCGCTVIGSNTPPVTEFIEDGKTGLLVDFFDTRGLAERTVEALSNPKKFQHLGANARRLIVEKYDLTGVCLPKLIELITRNGAR